MSPFRFRKRIRIFPGVHVNLSNRWPPSVSIGPRGVQWNSRTGKTSVDLPGPVNWQSRGRRRAGRGELVSVPRRRFGGVWLVVAALGVLFVIGRLWG